MSLDAEISAGGSMAPHSTAYNKASEVFRSSNGFNSFNNRTSPYDSFAAADTNQDGVLSAEEFRNAGY